MFRDGDHVEVDNAPFHRADDALVLLQRLGRKGTGLVYTPYYSPEFNAAELVSNYLKVMLENDNFPQKKLHKKICLLLFLAFSDQ